MMIARERPERRTVEFLQAGSKAVLFEWSGPARSSGEARKRALEDLPTFWRAACHGRGAETPLPFDPDTAIVQSKRHDCETTTLSWGAHDKLWSALPERRPGHIGVPQLDLLAMARAAFWADAVLHADIAGSHAAQIKIMPNHRNNGYPFCGTVRVAVWEDERNRRHRDGAMTPALRRALMAVMAACAASLRYDASTRMPALSGDKVDAIASATLRAAKLATARSPEALEPIAATLDAMGLDALARDVRAEVSS